MKPSFRYEYTCNYAKDQLEEVGLLKLHNSRVPTLCYEYVCALNFAFVMCGLLVAGYYTIGLENFRGLVYYVDISRIFFLWFTSLPTCFC